MADDDEDIEEDSASTWYEKRYGNPPTYSDVVNQLALTDDGLLVAGWSVQYDPALRDAVTAHYPSRFTMGWVSPGALGLDAQSIADSKKALVFQTTADNAFGHLADEVEAMRDRHARHPLTLDVAVGRIKRQLAGARPAIPARDMLVSEFARLRDIPALHRNRRMDSDSAYYESSLNQVEEACRLAVGCSAALAYWGDAKTDRWWLPEIARFGRIDIASGAVRLIHLPLVAATLLSYGAGVAAVAAERFDLLRKLFVLRVNRVGHTPQPTPEILTPATIIEGDYPQLYDAILAVVGDALGLDAEPVDEALQLFEILRLAKQLVDSEGYESRIREFATAGNALADAPNLEAQLQAWTARQKVVDQLAEQSSAYHTHLFAAERQYETGRGRRWSSPIAERLADEIARQRDSHPVIVGLQLGVTGAQLAALSVGAAVGRVAQTLEWQAIPVGTAGFIPSEFWLDGRPTS